MASFSFITRLPVFFTLLALLISIHFMTVSGVEFDVGGEKGWVVPPSKDDQHYNDWASNNRFKVDDSLRFEYKKDSVLVVTKEEYDKCKSTRPMFFSNNENTVYKLDRPGLFYFISGVSGHCERGLKMVVKVLEVESPPQSANQTADAPPPHGGSAELSVAVSSNIIVPLIMMIPIVGAFFM